jgi:hypothetical protein
MAGPEAGITVAWRTTTARSCRHTRAGAAAWGEVFAEADSGGVDVLEETVAQEVNNSREK